MNNFRTRYSILMSYYNIGLFRRCTRAAPWRRAPWTSQCNNTNNNNNNNNNNNSNNNINNNYINSNNNHMFMYRERYHYWYSIVMYNLSLYIYIYIYTHTYIQRERERERSGTNTEGTRAKGHFCAYSIHACNLLCGLNGQASDHFVSKSTQYSTTPLGHFYRKTTVSAIIRKQLRQELCGETT